MGKQQKPFLIYRDAANYCGGILKHCNYPEPFLSPGKTQPCYPRTAERMLSYYGNCPRRELKKKKSKHASSLTWGEIVPQRSEKLTACKDMSCAGFCAEINLQACIFVQGMSLPPPITPGSLTLALNLTLVALFLGQAFHRASLLSSVKYKALSKMPLIIPLFREVPPPPPVIGVSSP